MKRHAFVAAMAASIASIAGTLPAQADGSRCAGFTTEAHRGVATTTGLNTVRAFVNASKYQAWPESDIRITADGHFVLLHDRLLERTTDGTGEVIDRRWNYIRKLHVDHGGRVPTVQGALQAMSQTPVGMFLELKPGPWWTAETISQLDRVVHATGMQQRVVITTFIDRYLLMLDKYAPDLARQWKPIHGQRITVKTVQDQADQVALTDHQLRRRLVRRLHDAGIPVYGRLADGARKWDRWARLALNGGLTNRVEDHLSWCSG